MNVSKLKLKTDRFDSRILGVETPLESDITTVTLDENGGITSKWQLSLGVEDNGRYDTYLMKILLLNYKDLQNEIVGAYGSAQLDTIDDDYWSSDEISFHTELPFCYLQQLTNGNIWGQFRFVDDDRKNFSFVEEMPEHGQLRFRAFITLVYLTPTKIQDDFNGLFDCGLHSDLILVADAGENFKVHKSIISARSVVFRRMFETDMKERQEEKVKLEGIRGPVLKEMLKFMYTGKLVPTTAVEPGVMEDLYVAADMYDVSDLKSILVIRLQEGINAGNVEKRLAIAEQFGDLVLKNKCVEFMANVQDAIV